MKLFFHSKPAFSVVILLSMVVLSTGCSNKKERVMAEDTYVFENSDWNFDDKFVSFNLDIADVSSPCKIILEVEKEDYLDIDMLQLIITITSPEGGESQRRVNLLFNEEGKENSKTVSVEAYRKKYFTSPGKYNFRIYRKYEKFNLYGIKSLTVKVVKLPEEA